MYIVTAEEMRRLDNHTIETIGIPQAALMENAGREIARQIATWIAEAGRKSAAERWLVLAGKGNNGGDGFVAARHLSEAGIAVEVALAEPPERMSPEAAQQHDIAVRFGLQLIHCWEQKIAWGRYTGVVDALLGTGTRGAPREPYAALIREANASALPIVAADIPSGLDAATGETHEPCIRAERTVALAFLKRGLVQYPGAETAGHVVVRPIGIPAGLAASLGVRTMILDEAALNGPLGIDVSRERRADTHKGSYGHTLIAAGTKRMSGAGLLCAKAALRAGCGLATWAVPASLATHLLGRVPEAMLAGLADAGHGDWTHVNAEAILALAEDCDALALGPGMGRYEGDSQWLRGLWEGAGCPLVLDADALNMLAEAPDFADWQPRRAATVLTPHPGEMARLAGVSTREVQRDRIGLARRYAEQHGVTLVLKGARTVVATPDGAVYVNVNGNAGMATAGAGDVLAGIIASLLSQGFDAAQAACLGVYMHGAAGDRAALKRTSPASLLAGDLLEEL
ncbi:NAD(P)H-hydrate dehydratase [Paenibacillus contaminans]|uniref:Bifunctional NAD(P)H-hydrate repair enzyme n=1 Tax=Paenibacillus contaminans TaxID=450362 RepID=A0A329MAB4_9BACL|nr:NAD(P)H-hydrate dehydratase [Paenibacillus contaminans]RAV16760.1 bifunctional ADP-dependent NAD(P)H-hydrate dehydratase/NAD(P)H-hydrate epimerase [Paenibacillus contaminans]